MSSEVAQLVTRSIVPYADGPLCLYSDCFTAAVTCNPPVYGSAAFGTLYRQLARDVNWFVTSLITNAEREGFGSKQIWSFSELIDEQSIAEKVRRHSIDESRHSKMFIR